MGPVILFQKWSKYEYERKKKRLESAYKKQEFP